MGLTGYDHFRPIPTGIPCSGLRVQKPKQELYCASRIWFTGRFPHSPDYAGLYESKVRYAILLTVADLYWTALEITNSWIWSRILTNGLNICYKRAAFSNAAQGAQSQTREERTWTHVKRSTDRCDASVPKTLQKKTEEMEKRKGNVCLFIGSMVMHFWRKEFYTQTLLSIVFSFL